MCSNGSNTYGNKLNCFSNYYYDRVGEWVSCELFERFFGTSFEKLYAITNISCGFT